jgi:hypothetical protein
MRGARIAGVRVTSGRRLASRREDIGHVRRSGNVIWWGVLFDASLERLSDGSRQGRS